MPPLKRWLQFLTGAGGFIGVGALFVNYGVPSDDEIISRMSPEVRSRYEKEKRVRQKMSEIMQLKVREQVDKPAWLQGAGAMQKFDREIAEEARLAIEKEDLDTVLVEEKQRMQKLAQKERGIK